MPAAAGTVVVDVVNTSVAASFVRCALPTAPPSTADYIFPAPPAAGVIKGTIALPADYDAPTTAERRAYVGFTGATGNIPSSFHVSSPPNRMYTP